MKFILKTLKENRFSIMLDTLMIIVIFYMMYEAVKRSDYRLGALAVYTVFVYKRK